MSHYVVKTLDGGYMVPRKNFSLPDKTPRYQTPRIGEELDKARVFTTKNSATRAMRDAGIEGEVREVYLVHPAKCERYI